ncbi:MAG: hypothetical protein WD824_17540 [Cyclobacteriaceae bacterium]
MNDTHVGGKFDSPCEDNVAFAVAKNRFARLENNIESESQETVEMQMVNDAYTESASDEEVEIESAPQFMIQDFIDRFSVDGQLPGFDELPSSLAMHNPIYPEVGTSQKSEPIRFTLTPYPGTEIQTATLAIKIIHVNRSILLGSNGNYAYPDVLTLPDFVVTWTASAEGGYSMIVAGGPSEVSSISFDTQISNIPAGDVTFLKYQFIANYVGGGAETSEVSFALQNFHDHLPDFPAPVYAQGNTDLIDILFIPAKGHDQTEDLSPETLAEFQENCDYLIEKVFFQEPVINFYSKEFNFWINKREGRAKDYRKCSGGCAHEGPSNLYTTVPQEIEVKALLHNDYQQDFTDGADLFSATMDNTQYHFFLHELGHAGFDLADEYKVGWHHEERIKNFPNNWRKLRTAQNDAVLRHKQSSDARKIR